MKIKLHFENVILAVVIIVGVAFSIFQFVFNRSLWLDESYLALNIMNRSYFELLMPLDHNQVAPILFLLIEKIFSSLMGYSEYGLRLLPLLSYWGAIYFLYKILKVLKLNIYIITLSLSLFVFNGTTIYYSSEVKQYMIDVLVITCMFYLVLKNYDSIISKYLLIGIIGVLSIFLSNVSPIILLCSGAFLFYNNFRSKRKEFWLIIIVSFIWSVYFVIYYRFYIYDHPIKEYMLDYWTKAGAFMPTNPFNIEFYQFIIGKYYIYYLYLFDFGWIGFYGLQMLFLLGCYNLMEKRKLDILAIGIAPIIVHLILSSFKLYPFDLRLILYTSAAFLIILSFGLEQVYDFFVKLNMRSIRLLFVPVILYFIIIGYSKLPIERSESKKSFAYLRQNIIENDKIYFTYFSKFPLQYYKRISKINFPINNAYYGKAAEEDVFIEEVDALNGRVWFVFSDFINEDRRLLFTLKERFNDKKHLLLKEYHARGSSVLLYEIMQK